MTDKTDPRNRAPKLILAEVKRRLRAGDELGFYIVEPGGSRSLSHTIRLRRGFFLVRGMNGEDAGSFRTLGAANAAGFQASKDVLDHGYDG